tara:strand:- start:685 stop:888 length:204 start_codon:yes stop_codon:yes gene_type:complete
MYDEAYKVYQGILKKLPDETKTKPTQKSSGLLGRATAKKESRATEPVDRIARYVANIRKDRRELNNG